MSGYFVNETYPNAPNVIRTADPLLIRLSDLALQVGDTVYKAIIKFGIKYCGFYIYQNCTGYPVYMYLDEELTANWARAGNSSATMATTEEAIVEALKEEAKQWIDNLEEAIANKKSDNEIKKALDRLCWQLHYDITESPTDFIEEFPDFSNVSIDTQGSTLPGLVTDIQSTISEGVDSITGDSGGTHGSLYSMSQAIGNMDTNVCNNLGNVNSSISNFDNNLSGASGAIKTYIGDNLYELNTSIGTFDTNLTGSSGAFKVYIGDKLSDGTASSVWGQIKRVADNLRGDNEYTVSKAIRDGSSASVAEEIKTGCYDISVATGNVNQTVNTISEKIGNPASGESILTNLRSVDTKLGSDSSGGSGVLWRLYNIDTHVTSIDNKVGTVVTNTSGLNTLVSDSGGTKYVRVLNSSNTW